MHFIGAILVPFFTDWGGLSFTQIMVLQSFYMFSVFILEVPTGTIADCFGRKQSLILSGAFAVLSPLVYASAPNFYVFLIGEFLWAMSAALLSGASEALVYDSLKKIDGAKNSKKVFARVESMALFALMVAGPIGSLAAHEFGLRAPMLLSAVPALVSVFIAISLKEPEVCEKVRSMRYLDILKDGVKFFYKNRALKILALDMISIGTVAYFMIWLYQPMLKASGVSIAYFGLVSSALVGTQILIMNGYTKLEKLFGSKRRVLFLSAFTTGAMFIIGGLTEFLPLVLVVILLSGGFGLSRRPIFESYMSKFIPSDKRATVISSISMLEKLALVIVSPLIGLLVDWSLSYTLIVLGAFAIFFSIFSKVEEEHLID